MIELALGLILLFILASPILFIVGWIAYAIYDIWTEGQRERRVKALKDLKRQGYELTPEQNIYLYRNWSATKDEVLY